MIHVLFCFMFICLFKKKTICLWSICAGFFFILFYLISLIVLMGFYFTSYTWSLLFLFQVQVWTFICTLSILTFCDILLWDLELIFHILISCVDIHNFVHPFTSGTCFIVQTFLIAFLLVENNFGVFCTF